MSMANAEQEWFQNAPPPPATPVIEAPAAPAPRKRGRPKRAPGTPAAPRAKRTAAKRPASDGNGSLQVENKFIPTLVALYLEEAANKVDAGQQVPAAVLRRWASALRRTNIEG